MLSRLLPLLYLFKWFVCRLWVWTLCQRQVETNVRLDLHYVIPHYVHTLWSGDAAAFTFYPASTRGSPPSVDLMLGQRRRQWASIKQTLYYLGSSCVHILAHAFTF